MVERHCSGQIFVVLIAGILALSLSSCTKEVIREQYVTVQETTYVFVDYRIPELLPRYRTDPPQFSFPAGRPTLIAVLPFLTSPEDKATSLRVAEHLEHFMLRHPGAHRRYTIVDRSRLEELIREGDLSRNPRAAIDARNVVGVEYFVTGFVGLGESPPGIKVKVIDARDSRIIFSQRVEGTLPDVAEKAAQLFHERTVVDSYDTTYVTRQRREPQLSSVRRLLPVRVREEDPGALGSFVAFVIAGLILYFAVR